jgi:mono/diheme cytochrome c family protein
MAEWTQAAAVLGALAGGSPFEALSWNIAGEPFVKAFPEPISKAMLERGRQRYNIFCAVCHDRLGKGDGMIVRRGFSRPPSYHIPRLRAAPVGHFFDVITNGFGAMPDYSAEVLPRDRWAIIAYIRALQASRRGTLADVPADKRPALLQARGRKE